MDRKAEYKNDLGSLLRAARDAKGLSKQDLARCLHLDVSIVSKIEDNKFGELTVPAFVHGYVRSISRELNINSEMIVQQLDSQLASTNPNIADFETRPPKQTTSDSFFFKYITCFLLVGLVILTTSWWHSTNDNHNTKNPLSASLISKEKRISSSFSDTEKIEESELYNLLRRQTISSYSQEGDHQYKLRPIVKTPSQKTHKNGIITIKSESDTWVEIRDGTGQRFFHDLNSPDETIKLIGSPPYRITIGNSETTKVNFDGSLVPFDKISQYGVAFVEIGKRN